MSDNLAAASVQCDTSSVSKKPTNIFDKVVINFYSIVCFVMSILLVLIISAATLMRYVFEMDLYGYEEWIKIFAFWLYFMGAGYGAFAGTHVSADLVQSYMKEGVFKRLLIFARTVITLSITGLFTWYGFDFFMFGFTGDQVAATPIPAWHQPQLPVMAASPFAARAPPRLG